MPQASPSAPCFTLPQHMHIYDVLEAWAVRTPDIPALVASGRDFMRRTTLDAWSLACAGEEIGPRERVMLRVAMTAAVQNAAQAVDLMWAAAGGSPIYTSSPLERCFRDIHVATQHAAVSALSWETLGKGLFDPAFGATLI